MSFRKITTAAVVVGFTLLARPDPAFAPPPIDVPGGEWTSAPLPLNQNWGGAFNSAGDSDWYRFDAVAGQTYQIQGGALDGHPMIIEVALPDGSRPHRVISSPGAAPGPYDTVIEWQADRSAIWFVKVSRHLGGPYIDFNGLPVFFKLRAFTDCFHDRLRTPCGMELNQPRKAQWQSRDDIDTRKVTLSANVPYYLFQDVGALAIVDGGPGSGRQWGYVANPPGRKGYTTFKVPISGVYYMVHEGPDLPSDAPYPSQVNYAYGIYTTPPTRLGTLTR